MAASILTILACSIDAQTFVSGPNWQNFGQVSANLSSPKTQTLGYSFAGSVAPAFSLHYGLEYSIPSSSCSVTTTINCSVTIAFTPHFPGLRQDALIVKTSSGVMLVSTLLAGTALGPQVSIFPGIISTIAGTGVWGYSGDGGLPSNATLRNPQGVAVDNFGNVFIADSVNQVVREISATTGLISTVVGSLSPGYSGDGGLAIQARIDNPAGLAIDGAGNLFLADQANNVVRRVDAVTQIITTVAGGGLSASGPDGLGDGGPALKALLNGPTDVAVDVSGNLFIADAYHGLIRRVDASTGLISVVAGGGTAPGNDGVGDGGPALQAQLHNPEAIALDSAGNLFIADSQDSLVRRVDAAFNTITLVAGNGGNGYSGDLGPAVKARLGTPSAIRVDPAGNLYIADSAQNVVRQVNAATGLITTVAGMGASRYTGDGGAPTAATLSAPNGLAIDSAGNLLIADLGNNAIRKIALQPLTLNFPATLVGQASPAQSMIVANTGNQNLTLSALTLSGNFSQFLTGVADCTAASVVTPASSCTAALQFVPLKAGPVTGNLTIRNNSLNLAASQIFSLIGTANIGAVPQLSLGNATLSFGSLPVGKSSATQTVTLSNPGTSPLSITSIVLAGTNAGDFTVSTTCSSVIAVNANCSISATFTPSALGSRSAAISFAANVAASPQLILSGVGVGLPQAVLNTTSLNFGSRAIGGAVSPKSVTLSNSGSGSLNINTVALSGTNASDFTLINSCGSTVSAGSACSFSISFNPRAFGLRTARLTLTDNAASATQTVSLTGFGAAQTYPGVFRPSNGTWYTSSTNGGSPNGTNWGIAGDIPVPADYDGDGRVDVAVFRPSSSTWYITPSSTKQPYAIQWGMSGDIPVPADYDGDGKADLAVYRQNGIWSILPSGGGAAYFPDWGIAGDKPVPGDYDGDGKADLAVYRPSNCTWYVTPSSTKQPYSIQWGISGDIPAPADFDGDGKADLAVYRQNGIWSILPSGGGAAYFPNWGIAGDIPLPADYDGDGKADVAVWRPASQCWYMVPSSTGTYYIVQFGLSGDIPLPICPH